jgi:hypothetical protein
LVIKTKLFLKTSFYRLSCETTDGMLLGGTGLGKPRTPASQVGQEAADELIESCSRKVCLDQYAQDQVGFISLHAVHAISQPNDFPISGDYIYGLGGWRFKSFGGTT